QSRHGEATNQQERPIDRREHSQQSLLPRLHRCRIGGSSCRSPRSYQEPEHRSLCGYYGSLASPKNECVPPPSVGSPGGLLPRVLFRSGPRADEGKFPGEQASLPDQRPARDRRKRLQKWSALARTERTANTGGKWPETSRKTSE